MEIMGNERDVALVLSGGSVNGTLMELGFLRRVRESELWPRVGWIFGTSAGALTGTMAALDRLDDLERFLLALQPEDAFRPTRLWRLPLLGTHDYTLPGTIAARLGPLEELAAEIAEAPVELVVCATDVTDATAGEDPPDYELVYSTRTTPPDVFASAVLASAAMSALVLPVRVADRIATDGAWVRNFPLAHAYHRPGVKLIVAFRYVPSYALPAEPFARLRRRLERFRRVPPVRALLAELEEAEERRLRNEPPHLLEMITRLMRITVVRNTVLEERLADEKDASIAELGALRTDVIRLLREHVGDPLERERLARVVERRFAGARFPFVHDRLVPRITVRAGIGAVSLEAATRRQRPWADDLKRGLIRRGYAFADAELRRHDVRPGSASAA
jgi:predicted acylesterase/phospholipase RssA